MTCDAMTFNDMTFGEILREQGKLQEAMGWPMGVGEKSAIDNLTHAIVEVTEALRELNFKQWKEKRPVDVTAFATELTDVIQFLFNAANAMGIHECTLTHVLREKWKENYRRLENAPKPE